MEQKFVRFGPTPLAPPLPAAIRRRGVPSDAAMFEVLYVYFGALLRSIRAAGFAIPPELEVVLLAPTSPVCAVP